MAQEVPFFVDVGRSENDLLQEAEGDRLGCPIFVPDLKGPYVNADVVLQLSSSVGNLCVELYNLASVVVFQASLRVRENYKAFS